MQKKRQFLHNVALTYLASCKKGDTDHISEMFRGSVYICFLSNKFAMQYLLIVITALFILSWLCFGAGWFWLRFGKGLGLTIRKSTED